MLSALALAAMQPVVVMVHGAGGGGWEYKFWKPVFEASHYRVVDLDLMPSKGGLEQTTFEDYVAQVVQAAGPEPAALVGASMGGMVVLKAAEKVKPKAVILVCSSIPAGVGQRGEPKTYPSIIRWANGPYEDTLSSMPDSDEETRRFAHPRWRDESGAVLTKLSAGIAAAKPGVPTLCVVPEADDTVSPESQQALAKWADADTHRYRGMSHVGPLLSTRATEVAHNVVSWLNARLKL